MRRFLGVVAAVGVASVVGATGAVAGGVHVGTAKRVPHAAALFDLSCPAHHAVTHSVCAVALQTDYNPNGMSLIKDGVPGPVRVVPPNGIHIACPTTSTCVLADRGGIGWVVNGQSTKIMPLAGMDVLNAVACMSASQCVAVGNSGNAPHQRAIVAVFSEGSSVAQGHRVSGATILQDVSCVGARCVAVGEDGQSNQTQHAIAMPIVGGKVDKAVRSPTLTSLGDVSCGAAKDCFAVGNSLIAGALHPYVVPIDGGKFGKPVADRASMTDISCWNAADCLGVNIHAVVRLHHGSVVSTEHVKAPSPLQQVACPTSAGCLISGGSYGGKEQVAVVRL